MPTYTGAFSKLRHGGDYPVPADTDEECDKVSAEGLLQESAQQDNLIASFSWMKRTVTTLAVVAVVVATVVWAGSSLRELRGAADIQSSEVEEDLFLEAIDANVSNIGLFCFIVVQPPPSYEFELLRFLYDSGMGIFQCESWAVYSDHSTDPISFGFDENNESVETIPIPPGPEAYWGYYHGYKMMLNAQTFYRVWEHVAENGSYRGDTPGLRSKSNTFIVKVDPDSVFSPDRLKRLLLTEGKLDDPDDQGKVFTNCWKWTWQGTMQGPLEVLTASALDRFGKEKQKCYDHGLKAWPEDHSLKACLQQLGSEVLPLHGGLYDASGCAPWGRPAWTDCSWPTNFAVYHPLKGVDVWKRCWENMKAHEFRV